MGSVVVKWGGHGFWVVATDLAIGFFELDEDRCSSVCDSPPCIRQLATRVAQSGESRHVDGAGGLVLLAPHVVFDVADYRLPCCHH